MTIRKGWAAAFLLLLLLSVGACSAGGLLYFLSRLFLEPAGIRNDGVMTSGITDQTVTMWDSTADGRRVRQYSTFIYM